jgi:acyl-homoserine lactone acylase PvdQ
MIICFKNPLLNIPPIRDPKLNWSLPVQGNTSATNWKGVHALSDIPNYVNPSNGWVQNCNSTPLYGTGFYDTIMAKKPSYMLPDGHTPRAVNAIRQLKNIKNANLDTILDMCHNAYLSNAAKFIPVLIKSFDSLGKSQNLKDPVDILRKWNFYTDTTSIATTLSVLWVEKVMQYNISKLKIRNLLKVFF